MKTVAGSGVDCPPGENGRCRGCHAIMPMYLSGSHGVLGTLGSYHQGRNLFQAVLVGARRGLGYERPFRLRFPTVGDRLWTEPSGSIRQSG